MKIRLILSNGNYKSGSTWVTAIVKEMIDYNERNFPIKFQQPKRPNYINRYKISTFINKHKDEIWISKTHISERSIINQLNVDSELIKVININRDIRDVVVSHYFHLQNNKKYNGTFQTYFSKWGKFKAIQVFDYEKSWENNKNSLNIKYEDLINNFDKTIFTIAEYLNITMSDQLLNKIRLNTNIQTLRSNKQGKLHEKKWFFRKGEIGDWKNYLDHSMISDIKRIQNNKLSIKELLLYTIKFRIRIKFKLMIYRFMPRLFPFVDKFI